MAYEYQAASESSIPLTTLSLVHDWAGAHVDSRLCAILYQTSELTLVTVRLSRRLLR